MAKVVDSQLDNFCIIFKFFLFYFLSIKQGISEDILNT